MPDRAKVTSLEALEDFRAKLIIYRDKAARVLDEVADEVTRARVWLETDRQAHWQNQIKQRTRELEQAQQELFSAQLSGLRDASYTQQAAVNKCRRTISDAEDRVKLVKQWQRQFDQRVESPARQIEKLRHFLTTDLGQAVAWLNEATKTLTGYAELSPSSSSTTNPAAPELPTETGGGHPT
jgi:chromosome segregation ATPase